MRRFSLQPQLSSGAGIHVPSFSRMQQNLPEELASHHLFLRGGRFLQGEYGIDHRFQFALSDDLEGVREFPLPPMNDPRIVRWRPNRPWPFSLRSAPVVMPQVTKRP